MACFFIAGATAISEADDEKTAEIPRHVPGQASRSSVVNFAELARREPEISPRSAREDAQRHEGIREERNPRPPGLPPDARIIFDPNPPAQASSGAPLPCSPAPAASVQTLLDNQTLTPPDTHGAVGPNHVMTVLNTEIRIHDKSGGTISTTTLNNFWSSLSNPSVFDPKLLYDPFGGRWMFTAMADSSSSSSSLLIGVSQTNDPTGTWFLHRIDADAGNVNWIDYPSIGFNTNWIAVSAIMWRISDNAFIRGDVFIFNKQNLYNGGSATFTRWQGNGVFDGAIQVPAVTHDNTLPELYLLQSFIGNDPNGFGFIRLYTVTGTAASPTLNPVGFIASSQRWDANAGDNQPVDGAIDNIAPQCGTNLLPSGTFTRIQINDDRMHNVVYRNGSLWAVHNVFLPPGEPPGQPGTPTRASVQWWEITPSTNIAGVAVLQRALLDDPSDTMHYGYPSIAVNGNDDVLIGFTQFSGTAFASCAYAYRASTDPSNTLRTPYMFKSGDATYIDFIPGQGVVRWGDYSNTVVDPSNDTDFWTVQQYAHTPTGWDMGQSGVDRWGTQWAKVGPAAPALCPPDFDFAKISDDAPCATQQGCGGGGLDIAYDTTNHRVMLYEADSTAFPDHRTYLWEGCDWQETFASNSNEPGNVQNHSMVYDAQRDRLVLFGGAGGGTIFDDTWEYDAGTNVWTQVSSGGAGDPPARFQHDMAYDAARGVTVLFGGKNDQLGQTYDDTWVWNGTSWSQESPTSSPSARTGHAMAYDPVRQVVVLYGGFPSFGPFIDETWEWDGNDWTQMNPFNSPGADGSMDYDPIRRVMVLYTTTEEIWEWNGTDWTQRNGASQAGIIRGRLVYDMFRHEMIMFDGTRNVTPDNIPETFAIRNKARAFCLSGTATGTGWSWCVEGPGYAVCDLNVPGVSAGSSAAMLAAQFAASINAAGCGGLDAATVASSPQCFTVSVAGDEDFHLMTGAPSGNPTCCVAPLASCSFNPDIFEVVLSGIDCDQNGADDSIDLAAGTVADADGNGIPDSCECAGCQLHGDIFPSPTGNCVIDVDDILEVLRGFADGAGARPWTDMFPCGGNAAVDVDDILSALRAFAGDYDCPHPCPP